MEEKLLVPIHNGGITDNYTWTQTAYDLTVIIPLPEKTSKKDILIQFKTNRLLVKIHDVIIVEGNLFADILNDSSMWYISNNKIEIELDKLKKHDWWKCVIQGHPEIDTTKVRPDSEHVTDLDSETRATIDKMLYDQQVKEQSFK
jgi:hypothetical protein